MAAMIKFLLYLYTLFASVSGFSNNERIIVPSSIARSCHSNRQYSASEFFWTALKRTVAIATIIPSLLVAPLQSKSDDELARYAAEGNAVGVDGQCFMKKCALETSKCANDPNCLKGLACLARFEHSFYNKITSCE